MFTPRLCSRYRLHKYEVIRSKFNIIICLLLDYKIYNNVVSWKTLSLPFTFYILHVVNLYNQLICEEIMCAVGNPFIYAIISFLYLPATVKLGV